MSEIKKEERKLNDNEFLYEGEIVEVRHFEKGENIFLYKNIDSQTIKTLNPELYNKLNSAVDKFAAERDKLIEERKKAEEAERLGKLKQEVEDFKNLIKTDAPSLLKLNPKFAEPTSSYFGNVKRISFDVSGSRIELEYDPTVVGSGDWRAHKTDKSWVVEDANYHKTRYGKLSSATAKIEELANKYAKIQTEAGLKTQALESFATATGLNLIRGWYSSPYMRRYSEGHETYSLVPAVTEKYATPDFKLGLSLSFDNKVSVTAVKINKPTLILGRVCKEISFNLQKFISDPQEVKSFVDTIKFGKIKEEK